MSDVRLKAVVVALCLAGSSLCVAQTQKIGKLPPFSDVQKVVEDSFASQKGREPKDLISRSEAEQALQKVQELGWDIEDMSEIAELTLPDQHVMVKTFQTKDGRRFMRHISGRELMYDRLDRISEVSGGSRLIQDIVKLPDGERYARPKPGGGIPDLLDLLPKGASGQTRRIPDYHKPTGHLYTVEALIERLSESYEEAEKPASTNDKP